MNSTLLGATLTAYFISSALYLTNLHIRRRYLASYATALAVIGFTLQTIRLILQTHTYFSPFANAQEAIFFLSWTITALYLITLLWVRLQAIGALAMPLSVIALALVYRLPSPSGLPLAGDAWLRIHVFAIIASFALFAIAFCCAVFYLVQNKLLKSKKLRGMFRKLPPLETVDSLAFHLASVGFPLLTLGIITGIVGVELEQLRAENAGIRLIASAIAWLVYGVYLLAHGASGWRGKRANWVLIIGALLITLTAVFHNFK